MENLLWFQGHCRDPTEIKGKNMAKDLDGLWKRETFKEGIQPQGTKQLKRCLVFKIKRAADGRIKRRTSTLVAKGFTQRSGAGFFKNSNPDVGLHTLSTVLAALTSQG